MKILFIAPRFHTNQFHVIKKMINIGNEVNMLVQRKASLEDYSILEPKIVKKSLWGILFSQIIHKLYSPNKVENIEIFYFFPSFFDLRRTIKELSPDVIIYRDRTPLTFIGYFAAKTCGVKNNILYNQNTLYDDSIKYEGMKKNIKKYIKKSFFPKVRITPVYNAEYQNELEFNALDKLNSSYFIPLVFDTENSFRIDKKLYLYENKVNIISVGKYRDYKNHFLLVDAIAIVKNNEKYTVRIIGQATNNEEIEYYNELKNYIKSKNLDHIIKLYKNIEYSKMGEFYLISDIFVLTSKKEVASVSIIESMAHGLIPISTNKNGTAQYIKLEFGEIFMSMDSYDLASKIEKISKLDLRKLGNANYNYFKTNLTSNHYIDRLNKVLHQEFDIDEDLIVDLPMYNIY